MPKLSDDDRRRVDESTEAPRRSRDFTAEHPGQCPCGDKIEPGELVCFVADELCHSECV